MEAELFAAVFGLQSSWYISELEFSAAKKRRDINFLVRFVGAHQKLMTANPAAGGI